MVYFFLDGLLELTVHDDEYFVARRALGIHNLIFDEADLLPVVEQFIEGSPRPVLKLRAPFQELDLRVHLLSEDLTDGNFVIGLGEDAEPARRETFDGGSSLGPVDQRLFSEALSIGKSESLLSRQLTNLFHRVVKLFTQLLVETFIVFKFVFKLLDFVLNGVSFAL